MLCSSVIRAALLLAMLTVAGCANTPSPPQTASAPSAPFGADPQRNAATNAIATAMAKHDYRQALTIENDWAAQHPADLDFRHVEPAIYLLSGDIPGWEHSRTDLLQTWRRIRATAVPAGAPSFTVDVFKAGQDVIIADQCYERAGRFGVIYRFTALSPDHRVRSFFTVESAVDDNRIARELGKSEQVFTLDHFRPGVHETVAMLPGLPAYQNLRQRVLDYVANPQPISASSNGQSGLSTEGCSVNR